MTRAVEQIEHDIAVLEQSVAAIAQDLHTTYSHYLTDLGQAVKRQLVLAAYYICTQGYPEQFLSLSLSQKQELQRAFKQLATHAQTQLLSQLKSLDEFDPDFEDEFSEEDELSEDEVVQESLDQEVALAEELTEDLAEESAEELTEELIEDLSEVGLFEGDRSDSSITPPSVESITERSTEESTEESTSHEPTSDQFTSNLQEPTIRDLACDPDFVMDWQESLEKGISAVLHTFSYTANRLLQKTNILPAKLPDPLLEVAAKAGAEVASGPPNVLSLLIEAEGDREEESKITHVMTIRLRLSEIEFADATLGVWRSKLRGLSARLNQLERDYQNKYQEKTIATAEAAWRSIWFDE